MQTGEEENSEHSIAKRVIKKNGAENKSLDVTCSAPVTYIKTCLFFKHDCLKHRGSFYAGFVGFDQTQRGKKEKTVFSLHLVVMLMIITAKPCLFSCWVCWFLQTQRRRGERELMCNIIYSYHGKAVLIFRQACGPHFSFLLCFRSSSPAWGEKTPREHIFITAKLSRACSQVSPAIRRCSVNEPATL